MGACPGEQLPPWPPATHSAAPTHGQKSFVTEAEAIRNLNGRMVSLHDVENTLKRNLPPRDGNVPFPKTITCGGTQSTSHFSGRRDFTPREIACLQGFPVSHQFEGNKTAIKKQIGNAFPPCVVKAFYDHIRTWLQRKDGVQSVPAQARPRARPSVHRRHRATPAHVSPPIKTRQHVNGDLTEHEALRLALQESMHGHRPPASRSRGVIEILDEDESQSPVSAVAPLLERMSIAPPDAQPGHGVNVASPRESRSRSVTLDFSPGPSPGPGGARKRSLELMHDGEADEVMQEESPPKRERAVRAEGRDAAAVDDSTIPGGLPGYAGPRVSRGTADDEGVAVGRSSGGGHGVRESCSTTGGQDSHRGAVVDEVAARGSIID